MSFARPARSILSRYLAANSSILTVTSATLTLTGASRLAPFLLPCLHHHSHFHISSSRAGRRRSRFKNVKAIGLGLTTPEKIEEYAKNLFPKYSAAELEKLKSVYTPKQLEAILAGESVINSKDLIIQGRIRHDPYKLSYLEDFSMTHPILDLKPERKLPPQKFRFLSHEEYVDQLIDRFTSRALEEVPTLQSRDFAGVMRQVREAKGNEVDLTKAEFSQLEKAAEEAAAKGLAEASSSPSETGESTNSGEELTEVQINNILKNIEAEMEAEGLGETAVREAIENENKPVDRIELWKLQDALDPEGDSALAPTLGKVPGVAGYYKQVSDPEDEGLDDTGEYQNLKRVTGMSVKDILSIYTKVLVMRFVHNQTRLGKVRSASVFAIAGNGNGWLGIGSAKSTDATISMAAARLLAIRNMRPIRRYENRTIYGTVKAKISGTVVELRSRPPGFGLRVSHRIFEMCRAAGIHDLSAIIPRSKNPMNTVKATFHALTHQPDPEEIAVGRGKKLVDIRKVYYGGSVH